MAKFSPEQVEVWRTTAADYMRNVGGHTLDDITTGAQAWHLAHLVGITREAYEDRSVTDAHIQTVLEKICPKAVFKDRKVY